MTDKITSAPAFQNFSKWFKENYAQIEMPEDMSSTEATDYVLRVVDITNQYNHVKGYDIPMATKTVSTYVNKMGIKTKYWKKKLPEGWTDKSVITGWRRITAPVASSSGTSADDDVSVEIPAGITVFLPLEQEYSKVRKQIAELSDKMQLLDMEYLKTKASMNSEMSELLTLLGVVVEKMIKE